MLPRSCDELGVYATCRDLGVATIAWCLKYGKSACVTSVTAAMQATSGADALKNELIAAGVSKEEAVGKANAYHHAFWMALLVGEYGFSERQALTLGMAHEMDNSHREHRYPSTQTSIDMINNSVGASTGTVVKERFKQQSVRRPATADPGRPFGPVPDEGAPDRRPIVLTAESQARTEIRRQVLECLACLDLTGY